MPNDLAQWKIDNDQSPKKEIKISILYTRWKTLGSSDNKQLHVFIILSSSWSRLSVQLLITFARKLWNSSLTVSGSSSRFVCIQVTLESTDAMQRKKIVPKMSINKSMTQFNLWCCASTLENNARFSSWGYAKVMQSKQLVFHITCTYSQKYYKVNQSYNKILKCD